MTNEQLEKIERLLNMAKVTRAEDTIALIAEVRRLQAYEALLTDPASVHLNILRGTIPLSRINALHIAGATDYDTVKDEMRRLQAEVRRLDMAQAYQRSVAVAQEIEQRESDEREQEAARWQALDDGAKPA